MLLSLFLSGTLQAAEDGWKIKVQIEGLPNTMVKIGYQYGNTRYLLDSAQTDKKGAFVFEGDSTLEQGVYQIFLPDTTFFEFLISEDQQFSIKTEKESLIQSLEASGSLDNEVAAEYSKFLKRMEKKAGIWVESRSEVEEGTDSMQLVVDSLIAISQRVKEYQQKLVKENKGTYVSALIAGMMELEIPDPPAEMSDSAANVYRLYYTREHYFDNFDLSDPRMLRSGMYHQKIMHYMKKLTYQVPDSLFESARYLVEKSKHSRPTFQYTLGTLTNKYARSDIMGFDFVFARLAETYYLTGLADWVGEETLKKMRKDVRGILITMPGDQAKDIRMKNLFGEMTSLYSVDAPYTIVVFWSYSCGHCRKTIPKLYKLFESYKEHNVAGFAVSTDQDREGWQEYIEEEGLTDWINCIDVEHYSNFRHDYAVYSTPIIFILDREKKIVAKKIGVDTVDDVLAHNLKIERKGLWDDEGEEEDDKDDGSDEGE